MENYKTSYILFLEFSHSGVFQLYLPINAIFPMLGSVTSKLQISASLKYNISLTSSVEYRCLRILVLLTLETRFLYSTMEYYRRAVWLPFLDTMLSQFAERFNSQAKIVMGMCTIIPSKCVDSNVSQFLKASSIYGQFLDGGSAACEIEYGRWQRKWAKIAKSERPETVVGALKNCDATIYPFIAILLQIFATIPVTTATAERSFSALRLLKTYLRATMKEERLNGLALMTIRKDIQFKHDEVIDQYASEFIVVSNLTDFS